MRSHLTRGVVALLALTVCCTSSVRAVRLYAWYCMSESSLGCLAILLRVAEQHLGSLSLSLSSWTFGKASLSWLGYRSSTWPASMRGAGSQSRIASHHSQSKSRYLGRMPNKRTSAGLRRFPQCDANLRISRTRIVLRT